MTAVRRPGGGARVLEVARSHLDRRPAVHGEDEEVIEPEIEITDSVLAALEAVLHDRRVGPLRTRGWFRRGDKLRRRIWHQHVEGDVTTVGRPANPAGRLKELGEGGGLAGVHPAKLDLAVRDVGDPGAVR